MSIYVNRSLNLKQMALIGFDMDYTLVRYNTQAFEIGRASCRERV